MARQFPVHLAMRRGLAGARAPGPQAVDAGSSLKARAPSHPARRKMYGTGGCVVTAPLAVGLWDSHLSAW
eukprot:15154739-Heterocapsa_arctica.AAC.1